MKLVGTQWGSEKVCIDRVSVLTESVIMYIVFSKRQRITLRLLYAIGRPSVVCLSVVCDVGAPYSGG